MKVAAIGVLPALLLGLFVMIAHGAPPALPATNVAAGVLALLVVIVAGKRLATLVADRPIVVAAAVLSLEACTLLAAGIDGVHRWVSLGGVRLHPAAIGDPLLLLSSVVLWLRRRCWAATSCVAAGLALHVLQPDAGQATALATGALALALVPAATLAERLALLAAVAAGSVLAWSRPDPLLPVDMVETIVQRAFELHVGVGALAVAALASLPASALVPAVRGTRVADPRRAASVALAAYLSASIVVAVFGEFPTPVLGFGASPILGAALGLGVLAALPRATA